MISLGYIGYVSNSISSNTVFPYEIGNVASNNAVAVKQTISASFVVFIDLIVYAMIELEIFSTF